MEKELNRMPSGKAVNPLDRPIPGQSLTKPMGQYPWENPPKFTNPSIALGHLLDRFKDTDNIAKTLAVLKEGVSVKALAQGLILTSFTAGLFNANVAELIREDLETFIQLLAEKAGIKYKLGKTKNNNEEFYESIGDFQKEKKAFEEAVNGGTLANKQIADEVGEVDIPTEGPSDSLMNRPASGIMARGDI
tara:strand:- start:2804 stop:3376 length:573 start_codon:yes stop_codon:yes gene_type:complete